MQLLNSIHTKQSENLIAQMQFSQDNQNGINTSEENKAFLSIISHNIKNPFGALLGYSELFIDDYSELTETERLEFATHIRKTANLTFRYLERFFEWMYYKTDRLKPRFEILNLRQNIGQATKRALLEQNYLGEINFNIPKDVEILADSESMTKIFYYLLENAIKYSTKNGLIVINSKIMEDFVVVEIIDHGIGMSKAKIINLFDITKNIAQSEEGLENGTGMGLILTKQLLKLNNSSINIESNPNLGTKVVLKIPRPLRLF